MEGHFLDPGRGPGMTRTSTSSRPEHGDRGARQAADVVREAQEIMAARGGDTVAEMLDRDFEFALDLLIAGIEAMVARG